MTDVEEVRTGKRIANPASYFVCYAHADSGVSNSTRTGASVTITIPSTPSPQELAERTVRQQRLQRAREACIDGLRLLAYVALADDYVSDREMNIEQSYIEARLAMCGFDHDASILENVTGLALGLAVPTRSFVSALNKVSKDREHFALIADAAIRMAEGTSHMWSTERAALERILEKLRQCQ